MDVSRETYGYISCQANHKSLMGKFVEPPIRHAPKRKEFTDRSDFLPFQNKVEKAAIFYIAFQSFMITLVQPGL